MVELRSAIMVQTDYINIQTNYFIRLSEITKITVRTRSRTFFFSSGVAISWLIRVHFASTSATRAPPKSARD